MSATVRFHVLCPEESGANEGKKKFSTQDFKSLVLERYQHTNFVQPSHQ